MRKRVALRTFNGSWKEESVTAFEKSSVSAEILSIVFAWALRVWLCVGAREGRMRNDLQHTPREPKAISLAVPARRSFASLRAGESRAYFCTRRESRGRAERRETEGACVRPAAPGFRALPPRRGN